MRDGTNRQDPGGDEDDDGGPAEAPLELTHLTSFIEAGWRVIIGRVEPFDSVAIAASCTKLWVTLVRRPGESADQLIRRVEEALRRWAETGEGTHEINVSQRDRLNGAVATGRLPVNGDATP